MPIAEVDGSGNIQTAYTWGAQGLISDRTESASRFYKFDAIGNTRALLDESGSVLGTAAYTAYGNPITNTLPTPFQYGGRFGARTDAETGLIDMEARFYAPSLGRFLSRDQAGYVSGINLYGYCGGDPVNFCDPHGNCIQIIIGAACGAVIGGGMAYINGQDVLTGAGRGALTGAIAGALGPLAGAAVEGLCAEAGAGCLASSIIGGVADGVVADAATQGTEMALGWRCSFDPTELLTSGAMGGFGGWLKGGCFVAGTMVATEHGFTPIEQIKEGDLVWTRNPRNGKVELKPVTATMIRQVHSVVTIHLANTDGKIVQEITATNEHPFFVEGKGWVGAGYSGLRPTAGAPTH